MESLHSRGIPKHSNMCDHVHQHPAPGYQSISTERYVLRNYSALKQKMGQQKNNKFKGHSHISKKIFPRLGCLMNVAQNELLMLLKPM